MIVIGFGIIAVGMGISLIMFSMVSTKALEGAILAHLRLNHALVPGAWMKSTELAILFGNVYPHIRYLTKIGLVEMMQREEPIYGPRGGRDSFWYRWNGVGKRDVIVEKLRAF